MSEVRIYAGCRMDACGGSVIGEYPPDFLAAIDRHEERIPWMYLDTRGNVTAGIGQLLPTPESAEALPWSPGLDVRLEWNRVKACQPGLLAKYYGRLTKNRLSDSAMDEMRNAMLREKEGELLKLVSGFRAWPRRGQLATLDLAFNCGSAGVAHNFPGMISAMNARDYITASRESHRPGISTERNVWTASMILGCA